MLTSYLLCLTLLSAAVPASVDLNQIPNKPILFKRLRGLDQERRQQYETSKLAVAISGLNLTDKGYEADVDEVLDTRKQLCLC